MTSTIFNFNPSLLCSFSATSSFSLIFQFNFPSKPRLSSLPPRSTGTAATTTTSGDDDVCSQLYPSRLNCNHLCSYGRRGVLLLSPLPFLFSLYEPPRGLEAKASESVTNELLLIKEELKKVLSKGNAAVVLRLVFHDGGTFEMDENLGGMNGSIVFELDRPENTGLKKSVKILKKAKDEVDAVQSVSWADMIAVAGAEAVSLCGGPTIPIMLGRLDSMIPDPEGKLPEESLDASALKQCFQRKGFSTQELVALSGAHTIGNKGFGSPFTFDNSYYKILLEKPWMSSSGMSSMIGLPSDRALVDDDECLRN